MMKKFCTIVRPLFINRLIPRLFFLLKKIKIVFKYYLGWIQAPTLKTMVDMFKTFTYRGEQYGGSDFTIQKSELFISNILFYIFLALSLLCIIPVLFFSIQKLAKKEKNASNTILLLVWLFLPVVSAYAFSYLVHPIFVIRYFIFAAPCWYILTARGIAGIKNIQVRMGLIVLIFLLAMHTLGIYYSKNLKRPWREATNYILKNLQDQDVIAIIPDEHGSPLRYYMCKERVNKFVFASDKKLEFFIDKDKNTQNLLVRNEHFNLYSLVVERRLVAHPNRFCFIYTHWAPQDQIDYFFDTLNSRYTFLEEKHFEDIHIFFYRI